MPVRTSVGPGDVIGGKYRIERLLGSGGMGLVFVAHHEQLNRRVAIKCLRPGVAEHDDAIARFDREARAIAALESDHVTKVMDVGRLPDGAPYMVMELLEGKDLASILEEGACPTPREALQIIVDACDAIGEAHRLGIIHRDLKPANIFLHQRAKGTITKVLDFGISKVSGGREQSGLTSAASLMGSPRYMSPEQLRDSSSVTTRTDIWALGVTLYEILTGIPPFSAPTMAGLCTIVYTSDPLPLRALRPELPQALEEIIGKCLAKDPEERFASVDDLTSAIRAVRFDDDPPRSVVAPPLLQGHPEPRGELLGVTTRPAPLRDPRDLSNEPPAQATLQGVDSPVLAPPPNPAPSRRRRALPVFGLVSAVLCSIGGVLVFASTRPPPEAPAAESQLPAPPPSTRVVEPAMLPSVVLPPPLPSASTATSTDAAPSPSSATAPAGPVKHPPRGQSAPAPSTPAARRSGPADPLDLPFAR